MCTVRVWIAHKLRCFLLTLALVALSACGGSSSAAKTTAKTFEGLTAKDEAAFAGLPATPTLTHGDDCVADINRDGYPDLLLNDHTDQWFLLNGSASGKFTPAPTPLPLADRHGCA